jgi:energy-coupling factor transporter ATP-binding protein EcfA2
MLPFSSLPYPGLRPFRDYESDIFFGREEQTDELLARLDRCRFLAVTGASGCGKSSLVKAGMIPALNTGFMAAAGSRWTVCELRPGDRPLQRLTQALARPEILGSGRPYDQSAAFVEAALRRGPLGLIEVARGAEPLHGANLLILVDQFEEIFRNRERIKFDEADAFVALLLACAQQSEVAIFVVITMRSDYLGECAAFHGLPEAVSDSQYLTPRLTHEQLEEAITGPARVFSGRIEDKLVTRLINDFGADSDQLPLLQHALARMWAGRDTSSASPLLTVEQYEAIGADKALSRHGDEIYAELRAEQRRIAEIMFKRLSGTEDGRRDVRYSAAVYEVAAIASDEPSKVLGEVIAVAEAFRRPDRCFLAVPDGPVEPPTLLDLSHESLIRQWQKLVAWVANEAESAEMYRRLRDWALRWDRGAAERWRGPDLASAASWRRQHAPSPAWAERYRDPDQPDNQFAVTERFLAASEQAEAAALEAKEMQRRRQLQRARWMAGASGFTAASLVAAILIYYLGYVRPVDTYYKDYVKVWGVPKGIDRLSSAEAKHRPRSFKITTAGFFGHVLSMEAVTSTGEPVNGIHAVSKFSPAEDDTAVSRLEYGYDSTARRTVAYEISMDKQQHLISRVLYSSSTALLLNKEQEQPHSRVAYVFRTKGALARQAGSCAAYLEYEYSPEGY